MLRSRSSADRRPALHRLERCGWITATWRTTGNSRRAKYYELTRAGQKQLQSASDSWRRLAAVVGDVLDLAWIPHPSCARSNGGGGVLSLARRRPPGGNGSILVLARRLRHKRHAWLTGHSYWIGTIPAMAFVGVFMMPFSCGSRARPVPEYLRLRFDEKTRVQRAVVRGDDGVLLATLVGIAEDARVG